MADRLNLCHVHFGVFRAAVLRRTGLIRPFLSSDYTLVAEVYREQLACRTQLQWALWDGSVVNRLLRPLSPFGDFAAEMAGRWAFGLATFSLPLMLAASLMGVNPLPAGPAAAVLFLPSLALGVSVGLALEFSLGSLMVVLRLSLWPMEQLRSALTILLTGALVPLALYPWRLGEVFAWLPFAAMASAPRLAVFDLAASSSFLP